jgi:carboxyl-terminal processing protease
MKKKGAGRFVVGISLLIIAVFTAGFLSTQETRDFKTAKNLDIFFSLFRELNTFYVDEINPDKVIKAGIDGMLKSLDPYTVYYSEADIDDFTFMTTGKYGGIGSLVRDNGDYTTISEVYKGFPADSAGIKPGDIIKKVNGLSLKGLPAEKVSDQLKGDPGTKLVLTIERNGKDSDFTLTRERIAIAPVPYYGMLDEKTGYIRLTSFTQNCTEDVRKAFVALEKEYNPKQVILDLRGNPGGLLTEAVDIVNLFVGSNNEVVSTKGKVKQYDAVYKTTKQPVDDKIPLVVLINSGSASASEIVAGAIQDLDRGVIVGQRSYGKGLVQVTRPLSYNTQLKVTTAKYYIPSGRCIQALDYEHINEDGSVGVIPDSLISEFITKNGRIVKDGGGIMPDIEVVPETLSQIATELFFNYYIFDYATKYYWAHPEIKTIDQFQFTEQDFNDFKEFLTTRKFNYNTSTEGAFAELISNAKKEKYYDLHKDLFDQLEKDLKPDLDKDIITFKKEIIELIDDEIVGRYLYQEGSIELSLKTDGQVKKAIEVLNNNPLYTSILNGKSGNLLVVNNKKSSYYYNSGPVNQSHMVHI